jgi:hypothetical protein
MKASVITRKSCLVIFLIIGVGCSSQPKSKTATSETTLAAGIARLEANDNDGAAKILEQVTTHEPRNGARMAQSRPRLPEHERLGPGNLGRPTCARCRSVSSDATL